LKITDSPSPLQKPKQIVFQKEEFYKSEASMSLDKKRERCENTEIPQWPLIVSFLSTEKNPRYHELHDFIFFQKLFRDLSVGM